ncbi:hypothetical protein Mapa_013308 [Marchantia paleacea]|nr:hypothetical protein Mapa_013308 [Marchantia paleacea]
MGRSGCCGGFLRLGTRKRGKRIVPATRMHDGSASSSRVWATNGAPQSGGGNQYASLSPSLLAPPSSPASFQNSAVQSSAQSPATFSVSLSVPSATSQIPLETTATMFQMGPYAHETALVSPPVFSTFTTAPSTAPFTPPPELATHVTTPSSPDVPFAQLLANSFGQKGSVRQQPPPTYSASPFASPDIFAADDLQAAYQLYPGSPLAHLLSPTSGTGQSTPFPELELSSQSSPFPDLENPVQAVATMFFPGSPLLALEPAATMEVDVESLLLSQALNPSSFQEFRLEEKQSSSKSVVVLERGVDDSSKNEAVLRSVDASSGRDSNDGACDDSSKAVVSSACTSTGNPLELERETRPDRVEGQDRGCEEQEETDLFALLEADDRSSSGASELADWKRSQSSVDCEAKEILAAKVSRMDDSGNEDEEAFVNNERKFMESTSRYCYQGSDDTVAPVSLASEQGVADAINSKESLTPEIRVQHETELSRSSRRSTLESGHAARSFHGEVCADCDRNRDVWAASSRNSSDAGAPQQQTLTGYAETGWY